MKLTKALAKTTSKRFYSIPQPFTYKNTRLGWIGTGVMGRYMCQNCMVAGYKDVTVYTRTAEKAIPLLDMGAKWADSPKQVAQQSDVVITIVGYPSDVREVIMGEQGVLKGLRKGGVVIDMTTSQPSLAKEIYEEAEKLGVHAVDCPVSGGDIGARDAKLTMFVGGNEDVVSAIRPLLSAMGQAINYMGGPGSGQHTKMANQLFIASGMISVVEGILYAYRAGLDVEKVISAVEVGAAGSWSLKNYGPRMLRRDFRPGFTVKHFIKDMEIVLEECKRMNIILPGLNLAKSFYDALKIHGYGEKGTHALLIALEKLNNCQITGFRE